MTDGPQRLYRDTQLRGFGLRVGKTVKSYYVEKRVEGSTVRTTIGEHGQVTCEDARKAAQKLLGTMATGVNPNQARQRKRNSDLTLREAFELVLSARANLRPNTAREYRRLLATALLPLSSRPISKIDGPRVLALHQEITEQRGPALANLAMRTLSSILNGTAAHLEAAGQEVPWHRNPVSLIGKTRSWNVIPKRHSYIPFDLLPDWWSAVLSLEEQGDSGTTVRDYLSVLLLTGLRREEAARIRWQDVDLRQRTLTIPTTKNHDRLVLPLSDAILNLLQARHHL